MRTALLCTWLFLLIPAMYATQQSGPPAAEAPVFRDPFTLKLQIDKRHYYQEKFGKIPYVGDGAVYLFVGDNFGIDVTVASDEISRVTYQKDVERADVRFIFSRETTAGRTMMLLTITNKLKHRLFMDALMTVPDKKEILQTSILPIDPGLADYESWPHPIVQLVLRNFRFSAKPAQ